MLTFLLRSRFFKINPRVQRSIEDCMENSTWTQMRAFHQFYISIRNDDYFSLLIIFDITNIQLILQQVLIFIYVQLIKSIPARIKLDAQFKQIGSLSTRIFDQTDPLGRKRAKQRLPPVTVVSSSRNLNHGSNFPRGT